MTRVASIDIGTNAVRLLVMEREPNGNLLAIEQERAITRLGERMDIENRLLDHRMNETISVLSEFREKCFAFEPLTIRAVATSAVREASNQKEFISRAKEEADIEVEVISWEEEASLMMRGVLWRLPGAEKNVLAFDIGGGSTEFILARDKGIVSAAGSLLGVVRLTEKFLFHHPVEVNEYVALEGCLRRELKAIKEKLSDFSPEMLVGTAGTVTTLAAIDGDVYPYDTEQIHGRTLTRTRVEELLESLKMKSLDERLAIKTMEKGREDLIIAGSALTLEIMRTFACGLLTVSEYGLREGVVLDAINQT